MEISNEEERLTFETLKCTNCDINLEQYYSYCRICKKKFCLNCLISHNCKEKMKIQRDVKLDKKNERNYGIDLLRIYSMFNVIILHSLEHGKILKSNKYFKNYYAAWFLETFCYSAVNTFGMISGYVMINTEFNGFKIIPLWLQVFFYNFSFIIRDIIYFPKGFKKKNKRNLLFSLFFPAITRRRWYYTCYFCMYFFIPFMNKLILLMNKFENNKLCLTILIIFCVLPFITLRKNDPFSIKYGYCPYWLMFLYIIGANLKLFPLQISKIELIIIYFLSIITPWTFKLLKQGIFIEYNSFFIVLNAICLISFFSQLNIKYKLFVKIIELISPLSFGVYLFHPWILDKYYLRKIFRLKNQNYVLMNLKVIFYSFQILLLCILTDFSRYILFKLLKINKLPITLKKINNNFIK